MAKPLIIIIKDLSYLFHLNLC